MRNNLARDAARAVRGVIEEMRPLPRPVQPALKLEMPDYYEGDPTQIANWIRSMETYFHLTKLSDFEQKILITLPRIRKGKADRAGHWSAIQLQEWMDSQTRYEELVNEGVCPDNLTYKEQIGRASCRERV